MMLIKKIRRTAGFLLLLLCTSALLPAQTNTLQPHLSSADRDHGFEEFRRGVQAYYRGTFNEAILLFEKALTHIPGDPLIFDWLGQAYYRSGIEGAALEQWEAAAASGYGGQLLKNKIEVVKERRSTQPDFAESVRYVETAVFESSQDSTVFFKQPVSVAATAVFGLPPTAQMNWYTLTLMELYWNGQAVHSRDSTAPSIFCRLKTAISLSPNLPPTGFHF